MAIEVDFDTLAPETKALVLAVKAEYERVAANIPLPAGTNPDVAKAMIAENVIRRAIEGCVAATPPFGLGFPEELAARMASYGVSIAPAKHHERILNRIRKALPALHAKRMGMGIRIAADWLEIPDSGTIN